MARRRGGPIYNVRKYRALRKLGYSKHSAAAITNAHPGKSGGRRRTGIRRGRR